MADITRLYRITNDGVLAGFDLTANTLVTLSIKVGGGTPTELTKTILDRLISTQDGSDLAETYHTHDTSYIRIDGTTPFSDDQSMGSNKLTNLADPTSAQDAATKAYVDANIEGLKPKQAVRVATTANIDLSTDLEDGDTLDTETLATGDRVLVKDQTAPEENGIYIVQASGAAVRSTDFDSLTPIDEINGAYTFVQEGTQAGQGWVQTGTVAVLETDPISFVYFSDSSSLVGGDMITKTGNTFSVDLATTSGLESSNPGNSAGQLRVKLEASNPSLQINGSNELGAKLDAAGAISKGASGLTVNTDDTTIEKSSNALRIKDSGVSTAKIAANAVDDTKARLRNNQYLRARNAADSADVNIVKVNASDVIEFASLPQAPGTASATNDLVNKGYLDTRLSAFSADVLKETMVAGETFTLNTLYAVRFAISETAGRMYKADNDATGDFKFYVIGLIYETTTKNAGDNITVYKVGKINVPTHGFVVGNALFLDAAGALTSTAPTADNTATVRVGIPRDADNIEVQIGVVGIN